MTQHEPIVKITTKQAILRLKEYCRENDYKIATNDLETKPFADDILTYHYRQNVYENYRISKIFNFREVNILEGVLIEIIFDFDLLCKNELLELGYMGGGAFLTLRRQNVRLPADREDVLL